jgi:hypothetical protein
LSENDLPKIIAITDIDDIPEPFFRFIGGVEDVILMYAKTKSEETVIIQLDSSLQKSASFSSILIKSKVIIYLPISIEKDTIS